MRQPPSPSSTVSAPRKSSPPTAPSSPTAATLEGAAPPGIPPELSAFSDDIDEQLQVVAAGHAFFGDRNDATLAFFAAHP